MTPSPRGFNSGPSTSTSPSSSVARIRAHAAYGLSPGDEHHPAPYLYVAPWVALPPSDLWQATGFSGGELPYVTLLDAEDQRRTGLEFFRVRRTALAA